jgi:squalene-hopene/tetraprenyl-beta-curcumene cyclase
MLKAQNADGSFGERLLSYETSAAIHALARFDREREDIAEAIRRAYGFLLGAQNTEQHGYSPDDPNYGSFGYGPKSRGDMSNTQFAIEALRAASADGQHDAFTKALVFLQRSQNLRAVNDFSGETTDGTSSETFKVQSGDDGGCGYYPGNS